MADEKVSHANLFAALAAFQAEVPVVAKANSADVRTKTGGNYRYTYATLGDVARVVYPILGRHGLSFLCLIERDEAGLTLKGILAHETSQMQQAVFPVFGNTPQEIGSALTYGRRYLLGCLTGVVTDDDDDGQAAQNAHRATQGRPWAQSRPEPHPEPASPPQPPAGVDFDGLLARAALETSKSALRELWSEAGSAGAPRDVLDQITELAAHCETEPAPEPVSERSEWVDAETGEPVVAQ